MKNFLYRYRAIILAVVLTIVTVIMALTMYFAGDKAINIIPYGHDKYCYDQYKLRTIEEPHKRYENVFEVVKSKYAMNAGEVYLTAFANSDEESERIEIDNGVGFYLDDRTDNSIESKEVIVAIYLMTNIIDERIDFVKNNKITVTSHDKGLEIFFDRQIITINELTSALNYYINVFYLVRITNA